MNRKLVVLSGTVIFIFILLLAFFYWWGKSHSVPKAPNRPGEKYGLQYREPGEIVVEDLGDTKRVTDKRQGYSVEVLKNSKIQEPTSVNDILYVYDNSHGCDFSLGFLQSTDSLETIISEEEESIKSLSVKKYQVSDEVVATIPAKRVILESEEFGYSESVTLATAPNRFGADFTVRNSSAEECRSQFSELLKSLKF